MHTEHKREAPLADMGYETRDLNYAGLGKATVFFLAFALFSFGSVGVWFGLAAPNIESKLDPRKPLPETLLQSNIPVRADIATMRQRETQILGSGGDNTDGSKRLKIEDAMNVIADRGLNQKPTEVKAVSPGNTIKQNALAPGEKAPNTGGIKGEIGVPPGGTIP